MPRSRIEADREDMLAEAVNLPERIEVELSGIDSPVTIGRNRLGFWSFYFGPEPVYRFDAEMQLRRAVHSGKLYRTQGTTLAELTRVRLEHETQLQRRDLSGPEAEELLSKFRADLVTVQSGLPTVRIVREVGISPEFLSDLREFLTRLTANPMRLAAALPTKRN